MKGNNHALSIEIENMKEEIHLLRSKNGESNGISLEMLRSQLLQHKSAQLEKVRKEKEDIAQRLQKSTMENEQLKKSVEMIENVQHREMQRLIDENANSNTLLKTRVLEIQRMKEEMCNAKIENEHNNALLQEKQDTVSRLQTTIKEYETKQNKQQLELASELNLVKEQVEMEKQKILAQKEVEMEELKSALAQKHEANLRYLSQQQLQIKQNLEKNISNLQQELSMKEIEIGNLSQKVTELKAQVEQMKKEEMIKQKELMERMEQMRNENSKLKSQMEQITSEKEKYSQLNHRINAELNEERKKVQSLYHVQSENIQLKESLTMLKEKQSSRNQKFEALKQKNIYLVNGCDSLKKRNRYLQELNRQLEEKVVHKEDFEKSLNAQLELLNMSSTLTNGHNCSMSIWYQKSNSNHVSMSRSFPRTS